MRPFSVVVAAAKDTLGIGKAGQLPWRLRGDMAFFKQLTRSTSDPLKRNAVIMGRKTWESIPAKFRPLDDRLNIVLTRSPTAKADLEIPDSVIVAGSLESALEQLSAACALGEGVETVYVIGGGAVYAEAVASPACAKIHITYVSRAAPAAEPENKVENALPAAAEDCGFECDAFFPQLDEAGYTVTKRSSTRTEKALSYEFVELASNAHAPPAGLGLRKPLGGAGRHEEHQYLDLVREVIESGVQRGDRTGTGTLSKFGVQMRYDLSERFPLLTTKSVFWRGVAEELLWFVNGETSAKLLQDKKIRIWDGNSSREYLDSIGLTEREEGDLGPVYGWQWRHFGAEYKTMHDDYTGQGVDQIAQVIDAIKNKPNDRRIIMTAWNPADLKKMALPPCHMFAQFFVADGALSCQMYQRSADLGLGVPFNIASYALLTCLFAHVCGLKRGTFVHTIGDAHVYLNHVDALKEQIKREPRPFPTLTIDPKVTTVEGCTYADLKIDGYDPCPKIEMKMAV